MSKQIVNRIGIAKLLTAIDTIRRHRGPREGIVFADELIRHLERGKTFALLVNGSEHEIKPMQIRVSRTRIDFDTVDGVVVPLMSLTSHYDDEGDCAGYELRHDDDFVDVIKLEQFTPSSEYALAA